MVLRAAPEYLAAPSELFSLSLLTSAGDFYGGFIGALVAVAIFFRRHPGLPFWRAADLCGPAIALGQAIGRIGCFMAGDDYGRPTDLPWAVHFTDPDAARIGGAPLNVGLHPVQLYESAACLLLFFVLVWLSRRKRFDGQMILAYTILYAIARFVLETFRGDADRGFVFGGLLSTSQFIALVLAPAAIVLWSSGGGGGAADTPSRRALPPGLPNFGPERPSKVSDMFAETFLQDLRVGLRVLVKEKSFCALAVIVLALGICGVTTMFSVVNGVMLRGFSFPNADRLVSVNFIDPSSQNALRRQRPDLVDGLSRNCCRSRSPSTCWRRT